MNAPPRPTRRGPRKRKQDIITRCFQRWIARHRLKKLRLQRDARAHLAPAAGAPLAVFAGREVPGPASPSPTPPSPTARRLSATGPTPQPTPTGSWAAAPSEDPRNPWGWPSLEAVELASPGCSPASSVFLRDRPLGPGPLAALRPSATPGEQDAAVTLQRVWRGRATRGMLRSKPGQAVLRQMADVRALLREAAECARGGGPPADPLLQYLTVPQLLGQLEALRREWHRLAATGAWRRAEANGARPARPPVRRRRTAAEFARGPAALCPPASPGPSPATPASPPPPASRPAGPAPSTLAMTAAAPPAGLQRCGGVRWPSAPSSEAGSSASGHSAAPTEGSAGSAARRVSSKPEASPPAPRPFLRKGAHRPAAPAAPPAPPPALGLVQSVVAQQLRGRASLPSPRPGPQPPPSALRRSGSLRRLNDARRTSPEAEVVRRANAAVAHRLQATPAADSAAEDERPSATPPPVPPKDTPPATRAASPRCGGRLATQRQDPPDRAADAARFDLFRRVFPHHTAEDAQAATASRIPRLCQTSPLFTDLYKPSAFFALREALLHYDPTHM